MNDKQKTADDEKVIDGAATLIASGLKKDAPGAKVADPAAAPKDKAGEETAASATQKNQTFTAEDISRMVAEGIRQDREARDKGTALQTQKEAFAADPLNAINKLPKIYTNQLGNDPAKWKDEASGILKQWMADFKELGIVSPNVGGANREGGITPNNHIGPDTRPPSEMISEGLNKRR